MGNFMQPGDVTGAKAGAIQAQTGEAVAKAPESKTGAMNGRAISLNKPPGFQEVNKAAMSQFKAIKGGNEVVIFQAKAGPPNKTQAAKVEKISLKGGKGLTGKKGDFDQKVEKEYRAITEGLEVNEQGSLVHGDHDLGITPEALVALIRAKQKTEGVATRVLTVDTGKPEGSRERFIASEGAKGREHLAHRAVKPFASGGAGEIFKGYELLRKEAVVIKEAKDIEEGEKASVELEMAKTEKANPDNNAAGIQKQPHFVYRMEVGGRQEAAMMTRLYSKGDAGERLQKGLVSPRDVVRQLANISKGIETLNKQHVLHGDIKLGNIFTEADGEMVIADFDGVWSLSHEDLQTEDLSFYATSSDTSDNHEGWIQGYGNAIMDKRDEIANLREQLKGAPSTDTDRIKDIGNKIKSADSEMRQLEGHLRGIGQDHHTYQLGQVAVQFILGRPFSKKESQLTPAEKLQLVDQRIEQLKGNTTGEGQAVLSAFKELRSELEEVLKPPGDPPKKLSAESPPPPARNFEALQKKIESAAQIVQKYEQKQKQAKGLGERARNPQYRRSV